MLKTKIAITNVALIFIMVPPGLPHRSTIVYLNLFPSEREKSYDKYSTQLKATDQYAPMLFFS